MPIVVLIGTLDTKGPEYAFVIEQLHGLGVKTILIDAGIGEPTVDAAPDYPAEKTAEAGGATLSQLRSGNDRGTAMTAMAAGATRIVLDLHRLGQLDAILALGGSGGTTVATAAMRALPIGVPKLMVSTMAAGDVGPYVGPADIMMLYPVIDFAGLNVVSERVLTNAVTAIAALSKSAAPSRTSARGPVVAITMFGVTTPAATHARAVLEAKGYEVLVFHANGAGGRSMERLIADGFIEGVLDLTTTELADELVGGTLSAGLERLEIAGRMGLPQVVSIGALDMVNFGPFETVPKRFAGRLFHKHNANVTLMRTTLDECAGLGRLIAKKLNGAIGPVEVVLPSRGVSAISKAGGTFYNPDADTALIHALESNLEPAIPCQIIKTDINDPAFATALAQRLDQLMRSRTAARAAMAL